MPKDNFPSGIVEGFYGPPWSHIDRLYMIRFLSEAKFDTYMYAPKEDEFHRAEWRKRYPEALSQKLLELIEACNSSSVKFVFTVSPGLSIVYSDPEETNLLIANCITSSTWVAAGLAFCSMTFKPNSQTMQTGTRLEVCQSARVSHKWCQRPTTKRERRDSDNFLPDILRERLPRKMIVTSTERDRS